MHANALTNDDKDHVISESPAHTADAPERPLFSHPQSDELAAQPVSASPPDTAAELRLRSPFSEPSASNR
ncbi:MAG: hypothetical protein ACRDQ1_07220 [Sciscionella sp.]